MSNTWKKRNELLAMAQNIQKVADAELFVTWTNVMAKFAAPVDTLGLYHLMTPDAPPYMSVRVSFGHKRADDVLVSLFTETKLPYSGDDGQWVTSVKVNAHERTMQVLDKEQAYLFTEKLIERIWQVVDALVQLDDVHGQLERMTIRNTLDASAYSTNLYASQLLVDMISALNKALEKGMKAA